MKIQHLGPDSELSPFVKNIMTFESKEDFSKTNLPFFADGFPGIMYHRTPNGLIVNPHKKLMPELFIYGQTIAPIEIEIFGSYRIIVFQLFPFTLKSIFGIDPRSINDNCFDLLHEGGENWKIFLGQLSSSNSILNDVGSISEGLTAMIHAKKANFDPTILKAIKGIMHANGLLNLANLAKELQLAKRTLERRFLASTGLLPKQFAMIIQFQNSLSQITQKEYDILTDVVYQNGYADQSHFIRVFKSFTGKTPKSFNQKPDS
ncbi:helix-turn-helix domain-containing protein [Pleomorphovibrio marinus]|uniref:helix-turn-helix domain-containing protein n=1 Tax=Pleomorphovibrio marinus TaxID=2164132 RepID=UPI000E0C37A5|nr:AraC family transcriptional regulator [Pleomorphovibrio marinus]